MGQKLHSITFHEDHELLNKNLTPDSDSSLSDHDSSGMLIACIGISKVVRMPKMIWTGHFNGKRYAACNMQLWAWKGIIR